MSTSKQTSEIPTLNDRPSEISVTLNREVNEETEEIEETTITIVKRKIKVKKPEVTPYVPYNQPFTITGDALLQPCLIEEFFKSNPTEKVCFLTCTCPKHGTFI